MKIWDEEIIFRQDWE